MADASQLGPIDEDVKFAWGEASKLKHEFERAANELERQAATRRAHANHAKEDWHGRYVSVFEHTHVSCIIEDAKAIAAEMHRCAKMLEQLAELAREENHRRQLARDWEAEHDKWEREHDGGIIGFIKDLDGNEEPKMPHLPEITPHPFVAHSPPTRARG